MNTILRCPKCGTTSATPGECDACHDADVRYFCPNHEPGLWLDGPTCSACESRRNEGARGRPPIAPDSPRRRSSSPARPRPSISPPRPAPLERPRREVTDVDPWRGDEGFRAAEGGLEPLTASAPLWQKLLRAALLARSMRLPPAPESDGKSLRRVGGCLVRLVLIALVLVVALATALYVYGRSLL